VDGLLIKWIRLRILGVPVFLVPGIWIHKYLLGRVRCVNLSLQVMHAHKIHLILCDSHQILSVN
jgi:hypothetical protein